MTTAITIGLLVLGLVSLGAVMGPPTPGPLTPRRRNVVTVSLTFFVLLLLFGVVTLGS